MLAVVQGLTEFLPVSSSGHLIAARLFFGIPDTEGTAFDAFLHLGTVAALAVYYWRIWWGLAQSLWRRDAASRQSRELLLAIVVATIPAALAGYFFEDAIAIWLRGPRVLAASFLLTAVVLWWFDRRGRVPAAADRSVVSWRDALVIGLAQIAALVPAVSRSGVTIAAGRARGLSRQSAVTFSFLMSAPIIAGASVSNLMTLVHDGSFSGQLLFIGTVVSFVSGLFAIYLLMRLIERMSFMPFVIYLVGLSVIIWIVA